VEYAPESDFDVKPTELKARVKGFQAFAVTPFVVAALTPLLAEDK